MAEENGKNEISKTRVLSKINMLDGDFEIKVGEIKELPIDYKEKKLTMFCLKKGDLQIISDSKGSQNEKGLTLDSKDVLNFLNQNSRTVIKQLKDNDLSAIDLNKLLLAERKGKGRKKVLDFIKIIKEVK